MSQDLDIRVLCQLLSHSNYDPYHFPIHASFKGVWYVTLVDVFVCHDTVYDCIDGPVMGRSVVFFVIRRDIKLLISTSTRTQVSHRKLCLHINTFKGKIHIRRCSTSMRTFLDSLLLLTDNLGRYVSSNDQQQEKERSRIYVRRPDMFSERIGLKNGALATLQIVSDAVTPGTPQFRYFGMNRKRSQDMAFEDVRERAMPVLAKRSAEEAETCMSHLIAEHPCIMGPILSGILNRRVTLFFGPRAKDMCDFGSANTSSYGLIIVVARNTTDCRRQEDDELVTLEWSGTMRDRDSVVDRIVHKYGVSSRAASKMNLKIM